LVPGFPFLKSDRHLVTPLENRPPVLILPSPSDQMIPYASYVPEQVRQEQLAYCRVSSKKDSRLWNGMAPKFAMITIVLATKFSLRGGPKFCRLEKFLPFVLITPQPSLAVPIPHLERPR